VREREREREREIKGGKKEEGRRKRERSEGEAGNSPKKGANRIVARERIKTSTQDHDTVPFYSSLRIIFPSTSSLSRKQRSILCLARGWGPLLSSIFSRGDPPHLNPTSLASSCSCMDGIQRARLRRG
jgi:hypothetical protein